jgi:hypothetical protein
MAWHHFVARLVTALVVGAIIGAERQWHQRIAGLRTNALVSAGAAMFVSLSHLVPLNPTSLQVAAQVVPGIGLLGAGAIMPEGLGIRGLNTAATLWCSAAVDSICGFGFVPEAVIGASERREFWERTSRSGHSRERSTGSRAELPTSRLVTCFDWFAEAIMKLKCACCLCTF